MPDSSYSHGTFTEWLVKASEGKLEITGVNVAKALRHSSLIHVYDRQGVALTTVKSLKECGGFRLTRRGEQFLAEEKNQGTSLPFSRNDPPLPMKHWLSSLRRVLRNCPEGLCLAYAEGELRVLGKDRNGKIEDDAAHLVESLPIGPVVKA